jgi:formate dehydrogenase gamma subunit
MVPMQTREIEDSEERFRRFSTYRIVEHLALFAVFVLLAVTGLPQKFHTLSLSQRLIDALGGIDSVRLLHHIGGVLFSGLVLQHIMVNAAGVLFLRWQPSMLIALKDSQDAMQNVRYYLGLTDSPARCGRYTYKEKCTYWLVLIGAIQMVVTGVVLWFPVAVTNYLPGQVVPASKVIHTSEAMLIFLLVVTWHIYDSLLSPDVFPLNRSIFTGYLDRKRMKRLHPLELAELSGEAGDAPTGLPPDRDVTRKPHLFGD